MASDTKRMSVAEIASLAGVSSATVSKVINGRIGVSDETRERIEKIIKKYGFSKPLVSTKVSSTIELLITELEYNGFIAFVREMILAGSAEGLNVSVTLMPDGRVTNDLMRQVLSRNPLGIVTQGARENDWPKLASRDIPYVLIDPVGEVSPAAITVGIDNCTSAVIATEHLIKLGHTRIGAIIGSKVQPSVARSGGYMTALLKHEIPFDPELVRRGGFTFEGGYESACELLDLPKEKRPTALFAFDDLMAAGAYRAAEERGIRIPDDLSVIAFDNGFLPEILYPDLTSVRMPFDRIAAKSVELIRAARGGTLKERNFVFPSSLTVRKSTRALD